jgi:hypothetical protein
MRHERQMFANISHLTLSTELNLTIIQLDIIIVFIDMEFCEVCTYIEDEYNYLLITRLFGVQTFKCLHFCIAFTH